MYYYKYHVLINIILIVIIYLTSTIVYVNFINMVAGRPLFNKTLSPFPRGYDKINA